jgi:alpha-L-rhamnosidase
MRIHNARLAAVLVALAVAPRSNAQVSPRSSNLWTAHWITAPNTAQRDEVVLHFRKTIDLAQPPQNFRINVSADNQFVFYVNQQRIGSGPSRSDLANWRYETYDIAPRLHPGRNVLAATVWNFSTHAAIAQVSDRVAFLVHGEGDVEHVADTDSTWEVEQEKAIQSMRPETPGYYAAEPGERLNAAAFDWTWNADTRHPTSWTEPITLGRGSLRGETDAPNNWQLMPDPLPPMEMKLVPAGRVVRATGIEMTSGFPEKELEIPAHTAASILLDNGELTTAYPELTVAGGLDSNIRLTYSEALVDEKGEKRNRNQIEGKHIGGVADEFLPAGCSSCEFTPLAWRTWRYLQLDVQTAEQPVKIAQLRTWFTAYPFTEHAYFRSGDTSLQSIWDIGWRTARLDAHDTYMDTPYWERLQYVGDTRIQSLISYTVAGDDRLARQAIDAFNNSRTPDGLTHSRYPSSLRQMIPTFSLLWVGMVHDFWMYRDDPDFVRSQLPGTRTVLGWFAQHQRPDGLLDRLPWWPFVDWGKDFDFGMPPQDENGGSAIITLQFIEALRYAAETEAMLGDPLTAKRYRDSAARAALGVWKLCWNQQYGLLADTPAQQHFSQHANILGVWLDVIPPKQQNAVLTKILAASDSGFAASGTLPPMTFATYYFRFYLARALEHAGLGDRYLELLGPWKQMLSLGLTTWAESPEPTRSDSHAWSAHPNYDFLTIVAGIRPKDPGFKTIRIEPHLGALDHVMAAMPVPKGVVIVECTHVGKAIEAQVELPPGTSGELIWKGHKSTLREGKQRLTLRE